MGKSVFKRLSALAAALAVALPCTFSARADSRSYTVSAYDADVYITNAGIAEVKEKITFSFDGSFHGIYFNIDTSQMDSLTGMKISYLKGNTEQEIVESSSGNEETYKEEQDGDIRKYTIYEPSDNEDKTFLFDYNISGAVTNYADAAEFRQYLVEKNWSCDVRNVNITIHLPEGADKSDLRVFGHGPLTGSWKVVDGSTVTYTVPVIPASTDTSYLEALILFPRSLTPDCTKTSSQSIVSSVVSEETIKANQANSKREEARQQVAEQNRAHSAENILVIALLLFWAALMVFAYRKYDRELKPEFKGRYCRELPGTYSPAEMSLLVSKKLQTRDIMATLLDLVRRKQLTIEKMTYEKKGLLRKTRKEDYKIALTEDAGVQPLRQHEKFLMDWLIGKIGDGQSLLLGDIEEYAKSRTNAMEFTNDYKDWKANAQAEFDKHDFYDHTISKGKGMVVFFGIVYAVAGVAITFWGGNAAGLWLAAAGIVMAIYGAAFTRRTKYGNEQYVMWIAFKRFLSDYSQIKNAGISSIVVWEQYLVYAVSLGVAQNIIRYLPEIAQTHQPDGGTGMMYGMLYWQLGGMNGFDHAFSHCMSTMNSAVLSAQQVASSSNSSGTGFGGGGGFSGGGGAGGGGGGGAF